MTNEQYVIIPGTQKRVYEGSVVMLNRLPLLRWIIHFGVYDYNGKRQKGWYFSSIPADTTMPVFTEDLVAMQVIDDSEDPYNPGPTPPPIPPCPPRPFPPGPPAPIPIPFTPRDKAQLDEAMLTVETLAGRDKLGRAGLPNGKIVRVNDVDGEGKIEYYSWNADESKWEEASLGYRYMTRDEVLNEVSNDIIEIVWSNEEGVLVLTNHGGSAVDPVNLVGVAHDPIYSAEELTLRIPVYGGEDITIVIPKDTYIRAIRFEPEWHFDEPEPHVAPAIVVTVSNGETEYEIAGDASEMVNIYTGKDTATVQVVIDSNSGDVTANVKLAPIENNPLKVDLDNQGLWVDLSGVVGKKEINEGYLLVADGNGEFKYAGNGITIESEVPISDLTDPEKKVVTANLISAAITAAVSELAEGLNDKLNAMNDRIDDIETEVIAVRESTLWDQF